MPAGSQRKPAVRRVVSLAAMVMVLGVGAVSPPAAQAGAERARSHGNRNEGFRVINGDCEETGAFIAVDTERIEGYLPDTFSDHFSLREVGGQAVLIVVSIACRDVTVEGETGLSWNTNEAVVLLDPPAACHATHNSCEGIHHYLLWGPVDNARYSAHYRALGAPNRPFVGSKHNEVSISLGPITNIAEASLRGHYSVSTQTAAAWVRTPDRKATEWQIGSRGLVADSYEVFDPEFWSAGHITVDPEAGSPLADILGTNDPFTTVGLITQLYGTDTVELVPWEATEE